MKRRFAACTILSLVFLAVTCVGQDLGGNFLDLAKIQNGTKSMRVSSCDRTGGNNDRFENIPEGARRTLFQVQGAGIINHIWTTIAPPPPELSRNDIILRRYWDGSTLWGDEVKDENPDENNRKLKLGSR
jgi:hypothetical protein